MPNRDLALSAYPPHFLTFLRAAALNEVRVEMPGFGQEAYKNAVKTRATIYKMRSKMQREKHPDYEIVSKVVLRIIAEPREAGEPAYLLVGSPESEIVEAFERAGIKPDLEITGDPFADLDP
jgi:hypothetical protein